MKNLLILFGLGIYLSSCGFKTQEYYFDLAQFQETKVYHFACEEDSTYDLYWELQSNLDDQTLSTIVYDYEFHKSSKMIERFDDEGARLISFVVYSDHFEEESADSYQIIEGDVMLWSITNEPMVVRMVSSGALDFEGELKRERSYIDRAHIDVLDGKYEVIGFRDELSYSKSSLVLVNNMFYAEGLGLVAIESEEEGATYVRTLKSILTESEFKKIKKD